MRYYNRQGARICQRYWGELQNDNAYRVVARFEKMGQYFISTVWLGLDHNWWSPGNPPIIFETMVFGGPLDQEQDRYSTEEAALAGHRAMIEKTERLKKDAE